MSTTSLPDVEILRQVRAALVRHLIDIGRLSIQMSMSHLRLQGSLRRLPGVTTPLTPEIVQSIFSELGRVHGIRCVSGNFDNWRRSDPAGASWVPIEIKKLIVPPASAGSSAGTFDIPNTSSLSQQ